jgi:hypothetical protein
LRSEATARFHQPCHAERLIVQESPRVGHWGSTEIAVGAWRPRTLRHAGALRRKTMTKPMFSEDGENRPLLTEEELSDECLHAAATIVVALVHGFELEYCSFNDDAYKWPTSISRIELWSADDWWLEDGLLARAAVHEAGSMAVAKRHGRGPHLILLDMENSETDRLLDDPQVWKAVEALAQFIRDNYEREGCFLEKAREDCAMLRLLKSMDLPSLTQQREKDSGRKKGELR